jgi:hypothetical protein
MNAADFETVRIYEQYAAAAYCGTNINNASKTTTLVCTADNANTCPEVGTATVSASNKFTG